MNNQPLQILPRSGKKRTSVSIGFSKMEVAAGFNRSLSAMGGAEERNEE